jgi:lipopolysaccharide biosynthesis glycosyltransferase
MTASVYLVRACYTIASPDSSSTFTKCVSSFALQTVILSYRFQRLKLPALLQLHLLTRTLLLYTHIHTYMHREAKLVLGKVIPHTTQHFLYLDADILVCSDICALWAQRASGLSAVIDYGFPCGHSGLSSAPISSTASGSASPTSILTEQQWDPLQDRYFNAGLLLAETSVYAAAGDAMLATLQSSTWRFGDQVRTKATSTMKLACTASVSDCDTVKRTSVALTHSCAHY